MMKKVILVLVMSVVYSMILLSCNKDEDGGKLVSESEESGHLCVIDSLDSSDKDHVEYTTITIAEKQEKALTKIWNTLIKEDETLLWSLEDGNNSIAAAAFKDKNNPENFTNVTLVLQNNEENIAKRYDFPEAISHFSNLTLARTTSPIIEGVYFQAFPDSSVFDFNADGLRDYLIGVFREEKTDISSYFVLTVEDNNLVYLAYDIGADWKNIISDDVLDFNKYMLTDYTVVPIKDEADEEGAINALKQIFLITSNDQPNPYDGEELGKISIIWKFNNEKNTWDASNPEIVWDSE